MSKNWPTEWGKRPDYVTCYRGKPTFQRRKGAPRLVVQSCPVTDRAGFERECLDLAAAAAGGTLTARVVNVQSRPGRQRASHSGHTIGELATLYLGSTRVLRCHAETRKRYATFIDRALLTTHPDTGKPFGEMFVDGMLQPHAIRLRDALPARDARFRKRIKSEATYRDHHVVVLRNMFYWAMGEGGLAWVGRNPFARIKPLTKETKLAYSWKESEWERFFKVHPLGTKPHLLLALLRYLGIRISDAIQLGQDNIVDGRMEWVETKNQHSEARPIHKPRSLAISPKLMAVLEASTQTLPNGRVVRALDGKTFLKTRWGQPHASTDGVQKRLVEWCREAKLPDLARAHGMRRGGAKWLAENGATIHDIKGFGGWRTLANVQRYTKDVDERITGDRAVGRL